MKNKVLLSVLSVMLLSVVSTSVVATANDGTNESETVTFNSNSVLNAEENDRTSNSIELTLDITPIFDLTTKTITAQKGAEGDIKIKPIKNITDNSGKFVATIKDNTILTIDEKGHWKALKTGKTTFTLDYEYSQSAKKEISEKYPNYQLITRPEKQEFSAQIIGEESKSLDITPKFILPKSDSVMVGETGTIMVEPVEGIAVTGKFTPINDAESIMSFDEKGNWKAMKTGEKVIPLTFTYSEESLKKIEEKFPGYVLMTKDIAPLAVFKIFEPLDMKLRFMPATIEAQVGDTGKLTIASIGGVDNLSAVYTIEDKNGVIEVDKEGNWKALKAGETNIAPVAELTAESLQRIKEKNPYGKGISDVAPVPLIAVKVSEKPLDPKKIDPKAITPGKKNLPQTSESGTSLLMFFGSLIIISVFSVKKKLKYSE